MVPTILLVPIVSRELSISILVSMMLFFVNKKDKRRERTCKFRTFTFFLLMALVLKLQNFFVMNTSRELQNELLFEQPNQAFMSLQVGRNQNSKTAVVMRSVDPIDDCIMQRIVAICELLNQSRKYEQYTFFILLDQTFSKQTTNETLQQYFNDHNASHLSAPDLFSISENRIRAEFPALSNGYMTQKLVDGTFAAAPTRPFMWQLLAPAIAIFSHYHSGYANTWVFEEDVWSIGQPLVESFRRWDDAMVGAFTDLATFRIKRDGIPYNPKMQEKHTRGFGLILASMKGSIKHQKEWKRLLSKSGQRRSHHWATWDKNSVPQWVCLSDCFYRHSRSFSEYLYNAISNNIFQFGECYQQPLAWWGGFKVSDIRALLGEEDRAEYLWEHDLVNKITRMEAIRRFQTHRGKSILLYHGISSHKNVSIGKDQICHPDSFGLS